MRRLSSLLSAVKTAPFRPAGYFQSRLYSKQSFPAIGFAFDIDGVLTQGSHVLPQAKRILKFLDGHNDWNKKFPYILMTNGGGKSELERCKELSSKLETHIDTAMFVQSHTVLSSPILPFLERYRDKPILVLGGVDDKCREIAYSYGFTKVFIPADILHWNPNLWPFYKLTEREASLAKKGIDFANTPIHAIMVFHDPRNWAPDIQIALDVVRYGSATRSAFVRQENRPPESKSYREDPGPSGEGEMGLSGGKPVELVFCNPDLIWRGAYGRPRLGQGGFREAFQGIHTALEGGPYPATQLGKPTEATYVHAEDMLARRIIELYGPNQGPDRHSVYMIGDNPESDIRGAKEAGWSSILVHTGVYSPESGMKPAYEPSLQARDVEEAVHLAIERELEHV